MTIFKVLVNDVPTPGWYYSLHDAMEARENELKRCGAVITKIVTETI